MSVLQNRMQAGTVSPIATLADEHAQVLRTRKIIGAETACLAREQIDSRHKTRGDDITSVASDWKRQGRIFSVNDGESELFPAYQFDGALQPRPIIKEILTQLGDAVDGWNVAAWFHFPNGWLSYRDASGAVVAVAPKDALDRAGDVVEAARKNYATYVA